MGVPVIVVPIAAAALPSWLARFCLTCWASTHRLPSSCALWRGRSRGVKPPPLRELDIWEKRSALTLLILGSLLTVGALLWFGLGHDGGALVSKTVETTGEGATKKVLERDITLGNLKIDVVDDADLASGPAPAASRQPPA